MGGAINISNNMGAGRKDKADKAFGNTISLLLIASVLLTFTTLVFARPLLIFMGAQGDILELGYDYIKVIGIGAVLQVMGTGVTPLLRNQDKSWLAMTLMISNFVIDTVLSGVFVMVLGFGVTGAAGASLIGQAFALLPSLFILFNKDNRVSLTNYLLDMKLIQSIFKVGASPFGLSFIPSLTIVIINWQALKFGGTTAIAAYAVVSYILSAGQLLLQGIGDGSQPLISFYNGANKLDSVKRLRKWTYQISFFTGMLVMFGIILLTYQIPILFGVSLETAQMLHTALPLCGISLPLFALTRVASSYFYAIKESLKASLLIYSEVIVILPICVILLPLLFNITGLWLALVVTQLFLLIFSVLLLGKSKVPVRQML
jgi:putative MATE family efflux protein